MTRGADAIFSTKCSEGVFIFGFTGNVVRNTNKPKGIGNFGGQKYGLVPKGDCTLDFNAGVLGHKVFNGHNTFLLVIKVGRNPMVNVLIGRGNSFAV